MKDERLKWNNSSYFEHRANLRRKAEALLASHPDVLAIEAVLEGWWDHPEVGVVEPAKLSSKPMLKVLLQPYGQSPEQSRLTAALERFVDRVHPELDEAAQEAAAMVWGRVVGRTTARSLPDAGTLDRAVEFVSDGRSAWMDFENAFVAAEKADPKGWAALLADVPREIRPYLRGYEATPERIAGLEHEEAQLRQTGVPLYVWHRHWHSEQLDFHLAYRFILLAGLDSTALLAGLSQIPSEHLRQGALEMSSVAENRILLSNAIRLAPAVYSDTGWTGSTLLFSFVAELVEHVRAIESAVADAASGRFGAPSIVQARAAQELGSVRGVELPQWLRESVGALLQRPDGIRVAIEFGSELIGRLERAGRAQWAEEVALDALIEGLNALGASSSQVHGVWSASSSVLQAGGSGRSQSTVSLSGLPFLLLATRLSNFDRDHVWSWYVTLLTNIDAGVVSLMNPYSSPPSWVFGWLGQVLTSLPGGPRVHWVAAWDALYPQRCFARFDVGERDGTDPSAYLLRVGYHALAYLEDNAAAKVFWQTLFRATRQTVFDIGQASIDRPEVVLGRPFAYVPAIFGEDRHLVVAQGVPFLAASADALMAAAHFLKQNGMSAAEIRQDFEQGGVDLAASVRAMREWRQLGGGNRHISPEVFDELAEAILEA